MTTATASAPATRTGPIAGVAVVAAVALNAFGIWGDGTPYSDGEALRTFFIVCGFIAVGAGIVFGLVVPRGLRKMAATGRAGVAGLVLSVLALVIGVPAFWLGVPPVLAAGGIILGLAGRAAGARTGLATSAVAIGALALMADVAIYVLDFLSTNGIA